MSGVKPFVFIRYGQSYRRILTSIRPMIFNIECSLVLIKNKDGLTNSINDTKRGTQREKLWSGVASRRLVNIHHEKTTKFASRTGSQYARLEGKFLEIASKEGHKTIPKCSSRCLLKMAELSIVRGF
jgi:hypothetical protein